MSTVGISFGSATSGNGFDVATTVASIMAIQRQPETAWAARASTLQSQDSVLSTLGTGVSNLSSALSALTSFDGVFAGKDGASSDSSSVALTNVSSSAAVASHQITVSALAATSQFHSTLIGPTATLSGTLTLTVGSGTAKSITVAAGTTIANLATQINAAGAGVTASVITGKTGSYLSLVSNTGGAAGEIKVGGLLTSTSGVVGFSENQRGTDAAYSLDGVALTSGTNSISGVLPGVDFQLLKTTSSAITLQVANDNNSVASALASFITAYNSLNSALATQEGNDSSGSAEPLFGNPVVSQLQTALSGALSFVPSGSTAANAFSLTQLGITMGTDGSLSLDSGTLNTALGSNFSTIASAFMDADKFGQNFATALNNMGSTGNGTLALATANNASEESQLAGNKTNLETRLGAMQTQLTTELTTANQILQQIPQRLDEITQMFDAITGNGNKN